MDELIIRRADYGLELIDEFTQGPLVGSSQVTWQFVGPPPAGIDPTVFVVNRSRWVFESLGADVTFSIAADHYLSRTIQTGTGGFPPVPTPPGTVARVELRPRTGYPFAPNVTRAVGLVRLAAAFDPEQRVVPGATVTITPLHGTDPGTPITTVTSDDGQYLVWFLPELAPGLEPPWATGFSVSASATVDVGSGPTLVTGSIGPQTLRLQTFNAAPTIEMEP